MRTGTRTSYESYHSRSSPFERYRSFRYLKIEGLGRVNMITGRNNSGKSSLLEALRILAYNASPICTL